MHADRQCSEETTAPQLSTASACAHDLALVERLKSNCEIAWRELVTQFAGQVRARVIRVTKSCQNAEQPACVDDILAEVFRALLANNQAALRAYQGRSSLSTYLCAIATRVALRYSLRSNSEVQSTETLSQFEDSSSSSPEQIAIGSDQRQWLLQHVDRLPLKQRQLIRLFHLEGKSYKEISDQLSMPIGSIGPSIGRAEAHLKQLLGEDFLN